LLNEVHRWTGCFRHFTHLVTGEVPEGERLQQVIAAVMGLGMNYGLGKLARSTPFSYRQIAWAADWHIREDTCVQCCSTSTSSFCTTRSVVTGVTAPAPRLTVCG
jgi:hypothetical protein